MKRIVKNCTFFILLLVMIQLLSEVLWHIAANDSTLIKQRAQKYVELEAQKENSLDMIVIGDSESYTSISPLQLWNEQGITSYNCSQPGQWLPETYYLLKTAFKHQQPKVVLLETNILFREQETLDDLQSRMAEAGKYYFPIFRLHDIWKPLAGGFRSNLNYEGFQISDKVKTCTIPNYMKKKLEDEKIPASVKKYMKKIIGLCKEQNAELVLVSVPSPKNYNLVKHNKITDYAKEQNLLYLNLNLKIKELGIDWKKDSMDAGDHMNICGAEKVTNYLGNYLKTQFSFPNHRDDAFYQSWKKNGDAYQKIVQEKMSNI